MLRCIRVVMVRAITSTFILCLVPSFIFSSCGKKDKGGAVAPVVRTMTVSRMSFRESSNYAGVVCGRYESRLAFQVGGRITGRFVEVGSTVRSGQVLMQLDQSDLKYQMDALKSQVDAAQADFALAEQNFLRYKELLENDAVSKAEFDRYRNAYNVAAARLSSLKKNYEVGANQYRYGRLVAPADGIITEITAETGQVVSAGQPVMTFVRHGEREIQVSVPEHRIDDIRATRHVKVSFWALSDVTVAGKVREISPVSDKATRTYTVRVSLINPPHALKLGMTATVHVSLGKPQKAIFIPVNAVYQSGDVSTVWVVSKGRAVRTPVKLGSYGDNTVEVLSGLSDGDEVVIAGVHKLADNQRVIVMKSDEMFK